MKKFLSLWILLFSLSSLASEMPDAAQGYYAEPRSEKEQSSWAYKIFNSDLITEMSIVGNVITFVWKYDDPDHDQEFNSRFYGALIDLGLIAGNTINDVNSEHKYIPHYTSNYNHAHYTIYRNILPQMALCDYVDCSSFTKYWFVYRYHHLRVTIGKTVGFVNQYFQFTPQMISYILKKIEPTLSEENLQEAEMSFRNWFQKQGVFPNVFMGSPAVAFEFLYQFAFLGSIYGIASWGVSLKGAIAGSVPFLSYLFAVLEDNYLREKYERLQREERIKVEKLKALGFSEEIQNCCESLSDREPCLLLDEEKINKEEICLKLIFAKVTLMKPA